MGVHYLNSELGVLTYFNDTTLYNYITSFLSSTGTSKFLVSASTITTDGDDFLEHFNTSDIYLSVTNRGDTLSTDLINLFNNFFPNTTYKVSSADQTYSIYNNSNMFIKTKTESYFNPFFDGTDEYESSGGGDPNRGFIIGGVSVNSLSNIADELYVSFLVFNDDYTQVHNIKLQGRYMSQGTTYYDRFISISRHIIAYSSGSPGGTDAFMEIFKNANPDPTPPTPDTDPYSGGGYSGSGGGQGGGSTGSGGNYDDTSDDIPIPNPPTSISTGTGLFTAYNPSASQLAAFANAIWNKDPSTFDDWWRFFFGGDAFNAIIGLSMIPVAPVTDGNKEIYLGKWGMGVSAPRISNQYKQVDFGSLSLSEFWGNAIDYSPYTRVQLALPYIGIVDVDTDDVIGSTMHLKYNIDVLSGACTAMLECSKFELNSVIYEWTGSVSAILPVTGSSFSALTTGLISTAVATAGTAAGVNAALTGGASVPVAGIAALAGSAMSTFGSNKGKIQRSGNFSGNTGALGIQTPYFIISRPVQSIPSTQQATKGYPSNISAHLGDLTGYTELSEVHLHNVPGTKDEVLEIEELLKKGVIF